MNYNTNQNKEHKISLINQIRQKGIKVLWRNRKIAAISVLICANFFNNFVSFGINLVIARRFGPETYGVFSLAWSFMMAIHLIADLGLNLTIVRFFNLYNSDSERQSTLLLSLLILKLAVAVIMILLSAPLASASLYTFKLEASHLTLFSLAVASTGIFGLWVYFQNYLQAHRQFRRLAIFTAFYAAFRIVCFLATYIIFASSLNLPLTFSALYTGPLLIATGIGLLPVVSHLFRQGIPQFAVIKDNVLRVLRYGKWVAISGLCHSLIYRGVQFILAARTSQFELGIFSAGFVFTLAFWPINTAIRTVLFPYVTAYKNKDMVNHMRRIRRLFPYYIILVVVSILGLSAIQIVFLGEQYTKALPVFLITSSALTIMVFLGLVSMLVHTLMRPEIDAYTNIGRLITSSVMIYLLAPTIGAIGGALSYATPLVIGEVLMVLYVRKLVYARK